MTQPQYVRAAEYIDNITAINVETVDPVVANDIVADTVEKANAGAAIFFALYSLPKECWVGDGPAAQLLKRTGFAKAYLRAQQVFLWDRA